MLSIEDIQQQLELLAMHRRTLAQLLRQVASLGENYTPTGILYNIEQARTNIRHIKSALRAQDVTVDDHSNDEAISSEVPVLPNIVPPRSPLTDIIKKNLLSVITLTIVLIGLALLLVDRQKQIATIQILQATNETFETTKAMTATAPSVAAASAPSPTTLVESTAAPTTETTIKPTSAPLSIVAPTATPAPTAVPPPTATLTPMPEPTPPKQFLEETDELNKDGVIISLRTQKNGDSPIGLFVAWTIANTSDTDVSITLRPGMVVAEDASGNLLEVEAKNLSRYGPHNCNTAQILLKQGQSIQTEGSEFDWEGKTGACEFLIKADLTKVKEIRVTLRSVISDIPDTKWKVTPKVR